MLELCRWAYVDLAFVCLLFLNYNDLLSIPRRRVEHFNFLILLAKFLSWIVDVHSVGVVGANVLAVVLLVYHVAAVVLHLSVLFVFMVTSVRISHIDFVR
jgi:hypothetical protein